MCHSPNDAVVAEPITSGVPCKICGSETHPVGSKDGAFCKRAFVFHRCPFCRFTFVVNPWRDFETIYSADYYAGKGADPLVDYEFELDSPEASVRRHEWRGIVTLVKSLIPTVPTSSWLDFGCGNGGLVRYCRDRGICQAFGFESGAIRHKAGARGIHFLDAPELARRSGTFDVVTAIEVLEHVEDPMAVLRQIRTLLKPGGLLFYTTGNSAPQRKRFLEWRYVIPEVHVSFYEPETLCQALARSGFRTEDRGYLPGFTDILRFKVLKHLGVRRCASWQNVLPWPMLARLADARYAVTAHPIAWAV